MRRFQLARPTHLNSHHNSLLTGRRLRARCLALPCHAQGAANATERLTPLFLCTDQGCMHFVENNWRRRFAQFLTPPLFVQCVTSRARRSRWPRRSTRAGMRRARSCASPQFNPSAPPHTHTPCSPFDARAQDGRDEAVCDSFCACPAPHQPFARVSPCSLLRRPLKAQLAAELATASESEATAIRAEFTAREKALEHELDHTPRDVNIALAVSYSACRAAHPTPPLSIAHTPTRPCRLPFQVKRRDALRPAARKAEVVRQSDK